MTQDKQNGAVECQQVSSAEEEEIGKFFEKLASLVPDVDLMCPETENMESSAVKQNHLKSFMQKPVDNRLPKVTEITNSEKIAANRESVLCRMNKSSVMRNNRNNRARSSPYCVNGRSGKTNSNENKLDLITDVIAYISSLNSLLQQSAKPTVLETPKNMVSINKSSIKIDNPKYPTTATTQSIQESLTSTKIHENKKLHTESPSFSKPHNIQSSQKLNSSHPSSSTFNNTTQSSLQQQSVTVQSSSTNFRRSDGQPPSNQTTTVVNSLVFALPVDPSEESAMEILECKTGAITLTA